MAAILFPCDQAGSVNKPAPAGYTGPGDYATFANWWGLRAYSAAKLSGAPYPAIDIVKSDDGTNLVTINILATGNLDTASIIAHPDYAAPGVTVSKVYDQVGTTHLDTNAGLAANLIINVAASGLGSGKPSMGFNGNSQQKILTHAIPSNIPQPFCISIVCIRRADFGIASCMFNVDQSNFTGIYFTTSPQFQPYAGSPILATEVDGTWFAANTLFKSPGGATTSIIRFNGTTTSGQDVGAQTIANTQKYEIGKNSGLSNQELNGDICEVGVIASDASANFAAIENNQRTYWGI